MSVENKISSQQLEQFIGNYSGLSAVKGIPHPNIDPVFLHLGFIELRWYSLAYLFGILLGYYLMLNINSKNNLKPVNEKALENLPLWMILSIILGGRIGYVLFYNLEFYSKNLLKVFEVWKGGMSFHGGLIGVILGSFLFAKFYKEKYLKVTDLVGVVAPIGLFFGRIANFINQELVGRECNLSWCIIYPNEDFARYPSQIFEALLEGLTLFFIMFFSAKKFNILNKEGLASGMFLTIYSIFRFISEYFREPDPQLGFIYNNITMGQLLSLPSLFLGIFIIYFSQKRNRINTEKK
jgi:phosphatidylglycerol:prolipoprotein diacylglycerol transferase